MSLVETVGLLLLVLLLGGTGWICYPFFSSVHQRAPLQNTWHGFLSGFAALSLLLFLLALARKFQLLPLALLLLLTTAISLVWNRSSQSLSRRKAAWMVCGVGGLTLLLAAVSPPYEAVLLGEDASIYVATAFSLAETGKLEHRDSVVTEMSLTEREKFFRNRFLQDRTGTWARFPGGVRLLQPGAGRITFSFYHMFPVWLALGIKLIHAHFLDVLSLFLAITIFSIFRIVRFAAGTAAAVTAALIFYFFLPQQYFSRLPFAEVLGQAFFLSGLSVLAGSFSSQSVPDKGEQRLAGVLWGCLFLTRVDAIFLLIISILLAFSVIPSFFKSFREWLSLLRVLFVFVILAVFHQASSGEYLYLLTSGTFLKGSALVYLLIECWSQFNSFVQNHAAASVMAAILFSAGVLFLPVPQNMRPFWSTVFRYVAMAAAGGLFLLWAGTRLQVENFLRTVRWFFPYIPVWILMLQLCCTIYLIAASKKKRAFFLLCAIVLTVSSVCYLFRPMMLGDQPQNMRRFVPMFFPLWFALSISGAYAISRRLIMNRVLSYVAFSVPAFALGVYFFDESSFLFKNRLYADTLKQVKNVSERISSQALVLVPDSIAGLHMQLSLQYLFARNTLVLPLGESVYRHFEPELTNYVRRQIAKRGEVVAVAFDQDQIFGLFQSFGLTCVARMPVSFATIQRVEENRRPQGTTVVSFPISIYRVTTERMFIKTFRYDDPQVGFLGFHEKEDGFRWTKDSSMITNFSYPVTSSEILLTLTTGPGTVNPSTLRLILNDRFEANLSSVEEPNRFIFTLRTEGLNTLQSITIRVPTWIAKTPSDLRQVGISFAEMTFENRN